MRGHRALFGIPPFGYGRDLEEFIDDFPIGFVKFDSARIVKFGCEKRFIIYASLGNITSGTGNYTVNMGVH
jgi:hypothetical protein